MISCRHILVICLAELFLPATANLFTYIKLEDGSWQSQAASTGAGAAAAPLVILQDEETSGAAESETIPHCGGRLIF